MSHLVDIFRLHLFAWKFCAVYLIKILEFVPENSWDEQIQQTSDQVDWTVSKFMHYTAKHALHGLHGKKFLNPRTKYDLSCCSHTFPQTFRFVCCCQGLNFMASKHWAANHSHNWRMWNSIVSCDLLWTLTCVFESVLTKRRRPLSGSLSTLPVE